MSLRNITIDAPIFNQNTKTIQCDGQEISAVHREWESMTCKLVTPMYGGGVENAKPDVKQPIRVSAIRGQLRFWWRILAKNQFEETKKLSDEAFRQAEFALWGGMSDGDESGKASAVFLRVKNFSSVFCASYNAYSSFGYVLFPAPSLEDENCLLKENLTWELEWYVDKNADIFWSKKKENGKEVRDQFLKQKYQDDLSQVKETLRWWATFGGVGARTRRGCGAFEVVKSSLPEIKKPISDTEIQAANCKLATVDKNTIIKEWDKENENKKTSKWEKNDAMFAWEFAVKRLRDFRQGKNVGRNGERGRSRWTEPDAVRRLIGPYPARHKPEHDGGNQFPRGMFGMPIIFHFVGNREPEKTSLQPVGKERMSSPVIIRPILQNGQWQAAALLLPHDDVLALKVELKEMTTKKLHDVTLWDKTKANEIKPIQGNGGSDPLKAFWSYFVNPTTQK